MLPPCRIERGGGINSSRWIRLYSIKTSVLGRGGVQLDVVGAGSRQNCTHNSQLLLVQFYFFYSNFKLRELFFLGISYIRSILYTDGSNFISDFVAANLFSSPIKVDPHTQQQHVHSFPSHKQSTKDSIYAKQSLNFRIVMKQSSYRLIGLHSDIIYGLFIFNQSYKDQRQSLSTQF